MIAYPVSLLVVAALLNFVGEAFWATAVGLYLPAIFYLAPLVPITLLALWVGPRRLLIAPLLALGVTAFFLMGLQWTLWRGAEASERTLTVLSYNVDSVRSGGREIAEQILANDPDLVVLQECYLGRDELLDILERTHPHLEVSDQFVLASRYPIRETVDPPPVHFRDLETSARFRRHVIDTPFGPVALYNMHPISPRKGFIMVRGAGLRREVASGRLFVGAHSDEVVVNTELRVLQVGAVAQMAKAESLPVIVAGDTNLPSPSPLLRNELGFLNDGFASVGRGFGYTFPTKYPFLRIDRVLASDDLRFTRFAVGCGAVSDHHCVIAGLTPAR